MLHTSTKGVKAVPQDTPEMLRYARATTPPHSILLYLFLIVSIGLCGFTPAPLCGFLQFLSLEGCALLNVLCCFCCTLRPQPTLHHRTSSCELEEGETELSMTRLYLPALDALPSIRSILADDLDNDYKQDRLSLMPNLRTRLRDVGAHFPNHVAAQPVCGPSRSSFLSGRYPHNVGYVNNNDKASRKRYLQEQNNSIGTWLTSRGYHTAFLGKVRRAARLTRSYPQSTAPPHPLSPTHPPTHKYVNGLENDPPSGWSWWGGLAQTYTYYDATQWAIPAGGPRGEPISRKGTHQADFLSAQAVEQIQAATAASKPYFLSLTPLMVHWGSCYNEAPQAADDPFFEQGRLPCPDSQKTNCGFSASPCPTTKNKHAFDGLSAPHVPSWNKSASGRLPPAMQALELNAWDSWRQDLAYRNRSSALLDLDALIGTVLDAVDASGQADNTWGAWEEGICV